MGRARFLVAIVAAAFALSLAYAVAHFYDGYLLRTKFVLASLVPMLFTLVLLRRPNRIALTTHYLLAVILGMIVISPLLSEGTPRVFMSAIILPFLAVAAGGLRAGRFWTPVVALVLACGAAYLDQSDSLRVLVWSSVVITLSVGSGALLFEMSRLRAGLMADRFSEQVDHQVAQRREVEEALQTNRNLMAKGFQRSPSLMILSDLATGKILNVNDSFTRIAGWSAEEAIGKTLSELGAWATPEDRNRLFDTSRRKGHDEQRRIESPHQVRQASLVARFS